MYIVEAYKCLPNVYDSLEEVYNAVAKYIKTCDPHPFRSVHRVELQSSPEQMVDVGKLSLQDMQNWISMDIQAKTKYGVGFRFYINPFEYVSVSLRPKGVCLEKL